MSHGFARVMGQSAQGHVRVRFVATPSDAPVAPMHDGHPTKVAKHQNRSKVRVPVRRTSAPLLAPSHADNEALQYAVVREPPHERVIAHVPAAAPTTVNIGVDTSPAKLQSDRTPTKAKNKSAAVIKTGRPRDRSKGKTKK